MARIRVPIGVAGIVKNVEVLRADGSVKFETGEFRNLILNTGLDRIVTQANPVYTSISCATHCRAGTGNAPPTPTDLNLTNQVASAGYTNPPPAGTWGVDLEGGFCWSRHVYTFALGAINNQNIAELGIGWAASGNGTLFSRALILDANGTPTTITILSDEQLRVTWEFRKYWPTEDVTGELANSGNRGGVYGYTIRASLIQNWGAGTYGNLGIANKNISNMYNDNAPGFYYAPSVLGDLTEKPSGSKQASGMEGVGNFSRPGSANFRYSWGLTAGNGSSEGISCLYWGGVANNAAGGQASHTSFQIEFDPPIPKTAEDLLELDLYIQPVRV